MKKSIEIRNEIVEIKNKMKQFQEAGKTDEAYAYVEKINNLEKEYETALALETKLPDFKSAKHSETANALNAFNKAVKGMRLTDAENALVEKIDADGGYLVPEEQRTQIEELKRSYNALKSYCKVVPVSTMSGSMPIEVENNGELIDFEEMGNIEEGSAKFGSCKFNIKTKGLLIPISKQLLADEKANLLSYIDVQFAKCAVRTENKAITTLMKEAEKYEDGKDYRAIAKVLNTKLDRAIATDSKIYTNQDGFDYLDSLEDGNGRPLLQPIITDHTKLAFKGHEIVVLNNSEYTADAEKLEFWVGDLFSFCSFFDRMSMELAVSEEAGFKQYAVFTRAVERFDVAKTDAKAGIRVIIPTTSTETVTKK